MIGPESPRRSVSVQHRRALSVTSSNQDPWKSESDSEDFPGGFKNLKMPTSLSECHWQWALSWSSGDLLVLVFSCLPEL